MITEIEEEEIDMTTIESSRLSADLETDRQGVHFLSNCWHNEVLDTGGNLHAALYINGQPRIRIPPKTPQTASRCKRLT